MRSATNDLLYEPCGIWDRTEVPSLDGTMEPPDLGWLKITITSPFNLASLSRLNRLSRMDPQSHVL